MMRERLVSEVRRYAVLNVQQAKDIATEWLARHSLADKMQFGLPEIDDRYHVWRVPLVASDAAGNGRLGEIVIDARKGVVRSDRSTSRELIEARLAEPAQEVTRKTSRPRGGGRPIVTPHVRNTIALGDSEEILQDMPAECAGLVFTSPPYFNARPEYTDFVDYEDYLLKIRKVIQQAHRVLAEGRFFVMNVAPVLVRRASRAESSRRLAVPFDMHRVFCQEGFDFVDDIIWRKPEGAGWATGRGRRFAADRNPLQYKPVPVTEYVLVYRKHTDRLIDWSIRNHSDQEAVSESRIGEGYERTNVWDIKPASSAKHPAVFPIELAERVIRYYSFVGDAVLDPFAGIGTVGQAAAKLRRRFLLIEKDADYVSEIRAASLRWLGPSADILCLNCDPTETARLLL